MEFLEQFIAKNVTSLQLTLAIFATVLTALNYFYFKSRKFLFKEKWSKEKAILIFPMLLTVGIDAFIIGKVMESQINLAQFYTEQEYLIVVVFVFLIQLVSFFYFQTYQEINYRDLLLKRMEKEVDDRLKAAIDYKMDVEYIETKELDKSKLSGERKAKYTNKKKTQEIPVTHVKDLFLGSQESMMIMGLPGIGKTIALLQIAQKLIAIAKQDKTQPVPIIFELSTWDGQADLNEWLALELKQKYKVQKPEKILDEVPYLALMDGLDEQKRDIDGCIQAINKAKKSTTKFLVCSRIQEFQEDAKKNLEIESKVILQPLSETYIAEHIQQFGDSKLSKAYEKRKRNWLPILQTPYFLSLFVTAFQSNPQKLEATPEGNLEAFLFQTYLEVTYSGKQKEQEETEHYLKEIALQLEKEGQNEWDIDELQPYSWLSPERYKTYSWIYTSQNGNRLLTINDVHF